MSRPSDLVQGTLDLLLLKIVAFGPLHGWAIAQRLKELIPRQMFDVPIQAAIGGKVISREKLMRDVWDSAWYGSTKTLDVHVSALRKKLGDDPAAPRYIHTVRGVGFRFEAP